MFLRSTTALVGHVLRRPVATLAAFASSLSSASLFFPLLGLSFFPRTDAGQFVINLRLRPEPASQSPRTRSRKSRSLIRK